MLDEIVAPEDFREIKRIALIVWIDAVLARLVQAPFAVDIFDLIKVGIRRGREFVIIGVFKT